MAVSRLHLTAWNWFLKELLVIELVGFSRLKWNAGVCYRVYKNPTTYFRSLLWTPIRAFPPCLFKISIILFSHLLIGFSKWSLTFTFSIQNVVFMSHISFMLHVPCVSPPPSFDRSCNRCWRAQFFTALCTCLSRQPYSWLPKNIFPSGIVFLCWSHFFRVNWLWMCLSRRKFAWPYFARTCARTRDVNYMRCVHVSSPHYGIF
jgi:hypothetical protein